MRDLLFCIEELPKFKEWVAKLRQNSRSARKCFDVNLGGIHIELLIFSFFMTAGTKRLTVKLAVDEADGAQLSEWVKDGLIGEIKPS